MRFILITKKYLLLILTAFLATACYKGEISCENKYDLCYDGTRNYTLEFDSIAVVNEASSMNINGLLDPVEIAALNVYLKNNGPDPCMIVSGTFEEETNINGFYIKNKDIGINSGGVSFKGGSTAKGYKVQYIDPGATDYIQVDIRTYASLDTNQDVPLVFTLFDDDGQSHVINFSIHVQ